MTSQEFSLWLKGFLEGVDSAPTTAHMQKIQEKLNSINDPKNSVAWYPSIYYPVQMYPSTGSGVTWTTMSNSITGTTDLSA